MEATRSSIPEWTIAKTLQESRSEWTVAFDKTYCLFAKKISEYISKDIFNAIKESCEDPFKLQPTIKRTLRRTYPLNILQKDQALKLKEMSQEGADLVPFNEWFARFTAPKRNDKEKIVEEKANIIEDSIEGTSGPNFLRKVNYSVREQENDTAVDGTYFNERMAVIGQRICKDLIKIFKEFCTFPENQRLEVEVKWLNEGLELPSSRKSMEIEVELWLKEENGVQQQPLQLASLKEIEKHKNVEKSNQRKEQFLYLGIAAIFAAALGGCFYQGINSQWLKEQFINGTCKVL